MEFSIALSSEDTNCWKCRYGWQFDLIVSKVVERYSGRNAIENAYGSCMDFEAKRLDHPIDKPKNDPAYNA